MNLSLYEARVIGVLIEKAVTTPDQYPMSLNALTNACSQKTNREPVLSLLEVEVQQTVDELIKKKLVSEVRFKSRVPKYRHRFCNTEFSEYRFDKQELAIICLLLLRGPQTPGELRTRTNRQCTFSDIQETEAVLQNLIDHEKGPFVVRLKRQPGKRESRYAHLFSGEVEGQIAGSEENDNQVTLPEGNFITEYTDANVLQERMEVLELTVEALQSQIDSLKSMVEESIR